MNISTGPRPSSQPVRVRDKNIPAGATVTHDAAKDCFSYSAPGHHYGVCRTNPVLNSLKVGAFVAVPSLLGAYQNEIFGTLGAGLGGTLTGIAGGAVIGAAVGGYQSYHGSNKNPIYGALGGVAGAAAGAVLLPLLKQPGLWGGMTGALVATGAAAVGVGIWSAVNNHNITQDAKAHGWSPS